MNLLNCTLVAGLLTLGANGRTFTNLAGQKIEAEVVSKRGDEVTIKRTDGKEFTLTVASLSAVDQEFINSWQPTGSSLATPNIPGSADPRAKAGADVALEFPALPKDHDGNPATCNVRLPDDYDPAKPVPLLVWIGPGSGSNSPHGGIPFALVDKAHWAVAALPYPSTVPTPAKSLDDEKNFDVIIDYHNTMLAEVVKLLPNLDSKLRVVAGFSNGAHTIGKNIERGEKEFIELFNAFVVIEGGGRGNMAKKKLRGKYAYLAWGNGKEGAKDFMAKYFCLGAKDARLEITSHEMEGIGHEFPVAERALVKEWIEKTVIPGLNTTEND